MSEAEKKIFSDIRKTMLEEEEERIDGLRKNKTMLNFVWVPIKLAIAYVLITYIDYGLFIVIGYILFALENYTGLQYINSQEVNLQLNVLHQKIKELEGNNREG